MIMQEPPPDRHAGPTGHENLKLSTRREYSRHRLENATFRVTSALTRPSSATAQPKLEE
jgi:hypothetical protein